jgi:glycoside/pentoside/hexuronide:cation symporter, GPH family
MAVTQATQSLPASGRLSRGAKLVYGSGDWGMASYNTLRQIFYAIFLTDVVGLDPRLASIAAFGGIVWDAINDPLVGSLSDRVRTRWGRRRPFFLFFSLPFALGFLLLWWAPPWQSQVALMLTVTAAYMIADTLQSLVVVPFLSLTPELTPDYDERTSLTSYRMFFNLTASLIAAAGAPAILDAAVSAGFTQQQGYLILGALFGGLAMIPFLLMFAVLRERPAPDQDGAGHEPIRPILRSMWRNIPFRYATGINMLTWVGLDLIALMIPFYLTYYIASGDLLAQANLFGMSLGLETAVLGLLFLVAILFLPFWAWLAHRLGKKQAFIIGVAFWAAVQIVMVLLRPGQINLVLVLAVFAGIGVSTAHILPDAIFPDVIEWDVLLTRRRHEGTYYGVKNFVRKLTGALAIFIALQTLGWFGYQPPPEGALQFAQSPAALGAIRVLTGPVSAVLLLAAMVVAWFYPITRARHARMRSLLAKRQQVEDAL